MGACFILDEVESTSSVNSSSALPCDTSSSLMASPICSEYVTVRVRDGVRIRVRARFLATATATMRVRAGVEVGVGVEVGLGVRVGG